MILRKPYAFLIKNFRKINLVLLILIGFIFYKNMSLYNFVLEYLNTTVYNEAIKSIKTYINGYIYLSFIATLLISGILAYLLKYKTKPYLSYILILIANLITFILFMYIDNFFTFQVIKGFNLVNARLMRDLLLITSFFYYPMILILLIRAIGIDLKNFGFYEDKEITSSDEDREEIEVEVAFNKERYIRIIKNKIRHLKYFYLEHKFPLIAVFIVVFGLFSYNTYKYFYIDNRVYNMNEKIKSNNYILSLKHAYLTDKDYSGNVVSEDNSYFILADLEINNILNIPRDFDIEKLLLFVDNDFYVPTIKYNKYFVDMGNLYNSKSIKPNEKLSYLLVYKIKKPKKDSNFLIKYQNMTIENKLINIKVKIQDISTFKEKGSSNLKEEFSIPLNEKEKVEFKINNYDILDTVNYTYKQCMPNSCPIYEGYVNATNGKKILYLKVNSSNYNTLEFLEFLKEYGKISYTKDGKTYTTKIKSWVDKKYIGNHIYIVVDDSIVNSDSIKIVFTVRTYQYYYYLKGEK